MSNVTTKKWMRGYARANKIAIPRGFSVSSDAFGAAAKELTKRIEKHGKLPVNGTPDPKFVALVRSVGLPMAILAVAESQIGVTEHGANNHGVEVRKYLATCDLPEGYPWCAAFTTWCAIEAGYEGPWMQNKAYVPSWVEWAKANGLTVPFDQSRAGDFVAFQFDNDPEADHIGIVESRLGSALTTVEGNTSNSNWSDGDGVFRRVRDKRLVACVIRFK